MIHKTTCVFLSFFYRTILIVYYFYIFVAYMSPTCCLSPTSSPTFCATYLSPTYSSSLTCRRKVFIPTCMQHRYLYPIITTFCAKCLYLKIQSVELTYAFFYNCICICMYVNTQSTNVRY